jgi:hypothetical protein
MGVPNTNMFCFWGHVYKKYKEIGQNKNFKYTSYILIRFILFLDKKYAKVKTERMCLFL